MSESGRALHRALGRGSFLSQLKHERSGLGLRDPPSRGTGCRVQTLGAWPTWGPWEPGVLPELLLLCRVSSHFLDGEAEARACPKAHSRRLWKESPTPSVCGMCGQKP